MPGDRPLQARAGYNQGPQSLPLSDARYLGQPAIKCGNGDTVLFRAARVSPGENNVRVAGDSPASVAGLIINRSGGAIEADIVFTDPDGNEFLYSPGDPALVPDGSQLAIPPSPTVFAPFPLTGGWTIKLRIFTGNPTEGQGVIAWAWAHDRARNFVPIVRELTTTQLEIGPAEGRAWQVAGGAQAALASEGHIYYANFDSVDRTVVDEILHLANEDIRANSGVITVTPRVAIDSGIEEAYPDVDTLDESGVIIAYPDTLKFKAGENQTSAPLYLVATFAEFDLPKDQG